MLKLSKNEKERIKQHRIIGGILFLVSIILFIIVRPVRSLEYFAYNDYNISVIILFIFLLSVCFIFSFFSFVLFIGSFNIKFEEYEYNDIKIGVYAGFYHHYLKINGMKCDEYNCSTSFSLIKLSTVIENNIKIEATISTSNAVSVKVNDILIEK